jgi:hypothetical protein
VILYVSKSTTPADFRNRGLHLRKEGAHQPFQSFVSHFVISRMDHKVTNHQ